MMDQVMRSSIQLLKARATAARLDFWEILELGLELKTALDVLTQAPAGTQAPPVRIPDGPGLDYEILVTKQAHRPGIVMPPAAAAPPPPPPPPPPTVDLLYEKAVGFTNTENTILQIWLALAIKGDPALADDILRAGLLAEHYASLLNEDPAQISPAQSDRLTALLDITRDLITRANRQLSTGYKL